ncbi:MAG: hypothetical protein V4611_04305 [Patescibacteria group bacterium]
MHYVISLLVCVGLAIVWYSLQTVLFLATVGIVEDLAANSVAGYSILQMFHVPILIGVASLLVIPLAIFAFKRLGITRPRFYAVAFVMMLFFAFCLFGLTLDLLPVLWYQYEWGIWVALGLSLGVSALTYGFIVRILASRLSKRWTVAIIISLPVIALLIDIVYRFSFSFL